MGTLSFLKWGSIKFLLLFQDLSNLMILTEHLICEDFRLVILEEGLSKDVHCVLEWWVSTCSLLMGSMQALQTLVTLRDHPILTLHN
jgi:hypothetical protein